MRLCLLLGLVWAAPAFAQTAPDAGPQAAWSVKQGLATPESVLYDAQSDTYLVSNVAGPPLEKDNNGFISELSPEGAVLTLKLIAGGQKGVTLHAPKGLALLDGVLWVADIDTVRLFDRKTGAPRGEVKVAGATFVNDLAVGPDGRVWVSDSGLDAKFASTGTDGLYVIEPGKKPKLKTWLKSKALQGPNGLWVTSEAVFVVTFSGNELQRYDVKSHKLSSVVKLPRGGLDGLVAVGDELIISSWEAKGLYRGRPEGEFVRLPTAEFNGPADVGFDPRRQRLLVPRFLDGQVDAVDLPRAAP
jgi:sugar lactone lactonase YvrE